MEIVPIIILALGTVPKSLKRNLEELGADVAPGLLQKSVMLGTAHIIKGRFTHISAVSATCPLSSSVSVKIKYCYFELGCRIHTPVQYRVLTLSVGYVSVP